MLHLFFKLDNHIQSEDDFKKFLSGAGLNSFEVIFEIKHSEKTADGQELANYSLGLESRIKFNACMICCSSLQKNKTSSHLFIFCIRSVRQRLFICYSARTTARNRFIYKRFLNDEI